MSRRSSPPSSAGRRAASELLAPGTRLGRYELIGSLGSGGMARVYLARAHGTGGFERLCAVKVCHEHLLAEQTFVDMFLNEARLAAKIRHPNVVATIDIHHDEFLYLVMEYIEGGSLASLIKAAKSKQESLPVPVVLRVMVDVLRGLHAAHEVRDADGRLLNLVHRDVSPQNILVGTDGLSRITDFGVARVEVRSAITRPGEIKGKFSYASPDQLRGFPLTRRSDVFSATVVLWEALTQRRLFKGDVPSQTFALILSGPIASVSSYRPEVPGPLDEVIRDGLERDPDRRVATTALLADAIERCGVALAPYAEVGDVVARLLGQRLEEQRAVARVSVDGAVSSTRPRPIHRRRWVPLSIVLALASLASIIAVAVMFIVAGEDDGVRARTVDPSPERAADAGDLTTNSTSGDASETEDQGEPRASTRPNDDAGRTTETRARRPKRRTRPAKRVTDPANRAPIRDAAPYAPMSL